MIRGLATLNPNINRHNQLKSPKHAKANANKEQIPTITKNQSEVQLSNNRTQKSNQPQASARGERIHD